MEDSFRKEEPLKDENELWNEAISLKKLCGFKHLILSSGFFSKVLEAISSARKSSEKGKVIELRNLPAIN